MWKCPPSTVLVPVDFGDASARALELTARLAGRLNARVRVLHAETIETPPYFTHDQIAVIERERHAALAQAGQFLREFASRHGVEPADVLVVEGTATAAIVEAAGAADLVVMGTHGRRGPSRWWMGSVAERVVHESRTPVLVVRGDAGGVALEQVFERPMLVSPGGDPDAVCLATRLAEAFGGRVSDRVAACAADLAGERNATLVVVSKPAGAHGGLFAHPVEQWLRSCTLPMLFVPSPVVDRV